MIQFLFLDLDSATPEKRLINFEQRDRAKLSLVIWILMLDLMVNDLYTL
ncbi:hypothetical protein [Halothece sp. PCC 7418]|nr:hypothetical protein [Halothece sp. PCC 7418]